ncbi:MAG TPA: helix-turn-helix domain-containing protein [Pseudonocardia sp.]|uniref:helix-turn-helix transcriptional regulator n=1 Tax=Pseudonocardia sp. TaxID=60912 RepID=UPI002B4B461D|nr:helix-turn-helix domain-containing protein [Pseudonocardia sp.]HLU56701.1 helix-turn-helix domain-containing protein [Pseudonocardia sp.]
MDDFVSQVSGVSALAEPARRALYLYVAAQPEAVSRDQAAEGVGLPRHTAKFHLDKLVDEGLLDTEYRRLTGRRGPGAGRPTKLYRRSAREVAVTLPPRHYDLAGRILARAVDASAREGVPVLEAVQHAAAEFGHRLAAEAQPCEGGATPLDDIAATLAEHGYEPRVQDGVLVLANCPFHALAREHTTLVCGMNLHLITAMLHELGRTEVQARLAPAPGRCCVTLAEQPKQ